MTGLARATVAGTTFVEFGGQHLAALARVCAAGGDPSGLLAVFRELMGPGGRARIGEQPRYRSQIADDEAPFEFSIAFSHQPPEVQVYVEAQAEPPGLDANTQLGRAVLNSLVQPFGASLERLRRVEDLFFPPKQVGPFGLWIGASWAAGRGIQLKAYMNPRAQGPARVLELIREAGARLGFRAQWDTLEQGLSRAGNRFMDPAIVSLDLSSRADARIKVYVRCHDASLVELEELACLARDYQAGDVRRFYPVVAGHDGPYLGRPPHLEFSFVDGVKDRPAGVTLEFPIGSAVEDDESAARRVGRCLAEFELPSDTYHQALLAFATRPLHEHCGIHAHVTLRRLGGQPRVAAYFASEAYPTGISRIHPRASHWRHSASTK